MKVTIMRGIPGSGKSTYIKNTFGEVYDLVICSADSYFMKDGIYQFNASLLGAAHGSCLRKFNTAIMDGNTNIVVDNTNISAIEVAPYASLALAYGYDLVVVTLLCDFTTAYCRNSHGVPLSTCKNGAERIPFENKKFPKYWPHIIVEENV